MRLDKFIAKSTQLNKQQALNVIEHNQVSVNGVFINKAAFQVHENNEIILDGELLIARPFRYLLMNKPANTICSNVNEVYPSVLNLLSVANNTVIDKPIELNQKIIEATSELHIAGRLDADTTGLILITDDGRWTFNITLPTNDCKKVYRVGLSSVFKAEIIDQFKLGVQLQGESTLTLPASVEQVNEKEVLLTITEGKFHQVKRMFAAVGNRVQSLHREQIGDLKLDVEVGEWRYLTDLEIQLFHKAIM